MARGPYIPREYTSSRYPSYYSKELGRWVVCQACGQRFSQGSHLIYQKKGTVWHFECYTGEYYTEASSYDNKSYHVGTHPEPKQEPEPDSIPAPEETPQEPPLPEPEPEPEPKHGFESDEAGVVIGALANLVSKPLAAQLAKLGDLDKRVAEAVQKAIGDGVINESKILDLIKANSIKTLEITIKPLDGEAFKLEGLTHRQVPEVADALRVYKNAYMYGGAGAGKTFMAHQAAKIIFGKNDIQVFQLGKLSPESALKGFVDGHGSKQEQRFIEAIQKPGVIFLDEFDRWPSHLTTLLNSLLANGYLDARGYDTHIYRHDECYILAAGNTTMRGRNEYFPEAIAQEFSTIDRFFYVPIEYDNDLEHAVATSINPDSKPWVDWVQALRPEALSGKHGKVLATPRASYEGAKGLKYTSLSVDKIAEGTVFKGIESATRDKLLGMFPLPTVKRS